MIRLHLNENPLGMSPLVVERIRTLCPSLYQYPSPHDETNLLSIIASIYGIKTNQIVLGTGTSEILELIARSYLHPLTSSVYFQYSFELIDYLTKRSEASSRVVPVNNYQCDINAMIKAVCHDTAVIWLVNPSNPTGAFIAAHDIQKLLDSVPPTTLVVLDEAYIEYVPEFLQFDSIKALAEYKNLIVCRTFSKIYGLAGMRIGFALASAEIAAQLNTLRLPVSSNKIALIAAHEALHDKQFVARSQEHVIVERNYLISALTTMGISILPSYANFITIELTDASHCVEFLARKHAILVRGLGDYGLSQCMRISIGTRADHLKLLDCLSTYITHKER